jgi:hypothetical protein
VHLEGHVVQIKTKCMQLEPLENVERPEGHIAISTMVS